MRSLAYTRFELVRTFRNVRLLVFSFGFPLVLYFLIAAPNRHQHNFNGSGISIPLYYMVGLVAFGAMTALISSGARIATERTDGWTRQLKITPLATSAYFGAKVITGYTLATLTIVLLYASGVSLGVSLSAATLAGDDRADHHRADSVRGAGHLPRPSAHRRLDRSCDRWHCIAAGARERDVVPDRLPRDPARRRSVPSLLLARARQPRWRRRTRMECNRLDRDRRIGGDAGGHGPICVPARYRTRLSREQ